MAVHQARNGRPFGVTMIAVIQLLAALAAIYGWWTRGPFDASLRDPATYAHMLTAALATASLIGAFGLLLMVRQAWPFVLLVISVNMAVGLWAYVDDHPNYVTMTLNMVSVFYLNSRDVRGAFGYIRPRDSGVPLERP